MPEGFPVLLTPAEAAEILHKDTKQIGRWADAGRLTVFRTAGGHRRYLESSVRGLAAELGRPKGETS